MSNTFLGENKEILDVCCGGRMFWFDKKNPNVLFTDIRWEEFITGEGKHKRNRKVCPDQIEDFRKMSHPDETFKMVVFDPPHLFVGKNSYMGKIYGRLERDSWKKDLMKGFSECFRVLKTGGFLIFKWNESDIPVRCSCINTTKTVIWSSFRESTSNSLDLFYETEKLENY